MKTNRRADPKQKLQELIKLPENQLCADCGAKGPRWASASIGVFVCIRCSGIHRNLGTHLSFVRSVNLDEWKPEQVARMTKWGNLRAKEYFEHSIPPGYQIPNEHASVQHVTRFIRDKYEYCKFIPQGMPERDPRRGGLPLSTSNGENTIQQQKVQPQSRPPPNLREATVVAKKIEPKPPVVKQAIPDLLDFSHEIDATPPPPAPTQTNVTKSPDKDLMNAFSTPDFVDTSPPSQTMPPQFESQHNRISSDAIMAMYATPQFGNGAPRMPAGQYTPHNSLNIPGTTFQPSTPMYSHQQQIPPNMSNMAMSAVARPPMMNNANSMTIPQAPQQSIMMPGVMQQQQQQMPQQQSMMMMPPSQQQFPVRPSGGIMNYSSPAMQQPRQSPW
uniref:Arf-GAP domain-containing protein n=1 Tax=Aureoumbra lagunensis TaxID=44058 RepID=A0A7S3K3P3_9STRA|mmetsp:Transcript_22429/g.29060  ORF Transcript_22429/g.29060 Transcript_22429/m.29060 type:complete len:387 (-) Transcript_22429:272-1432(-)